MNNAWDEVKSALSQARAVSYALDRHASDMAKLLRGRLRCCDNSVLAALKRELREYNIHTGEWKQP